LNREKAYLPKPVYYAYSNLHITRLFLPKSFSFEVCFL